VPLMSNVRPSDRRLRMHPTSVEFHLEEFKQIRTEVTALITKTEALLQYTVVIAAGVFSWLATQALGQQANGALCSKLPIEGPLTLHAWFIPLAAVIVVGFLGGARFLRVKEMGKYLQSLEDALGNAGLGWEKFLAKRLPTVSIVTILAWVVLLLGTAYVGWRMQHTIPTLAACLNKAP
jgi:hypothetical protein